MHFLAEDSLSGDKNIITLKNKADFSYFSEEIAEYIIDKYQENIVNSIIKRHYNYLKDNEQMFIKGKCRDKLISEREEIKGYIIKQMHLYVPIENSINIVGFITFRLKEYIKRIENAVSSALNDFIAKREYDKFISGLCLFIELQTPLIDLINIFIIEDKYSVTDKNGNEIFNLYNYDDVLLDVIITLAPRRIIIYNTHLFKNKELLKTIMDIFKSRVVLINSI